MPSRQGHRKSRFGCSQCKKRRVKCDENVPCHNCSRRHEYCSLAVARAPGGESLSPHPLISEPEPTRRSRSPLADGSLSFLPSRSDNAYQNGPTQEQWATDLFLMHQYSTYTWTTLSKAAAVLQIWRTDVVKLATGHPFLMHGLLMLTLAHLRHVEPENDKEWALAFSHHQALALSAFQGAVVNLTEQNSVAVFHMASIMSILSMSTLALGRSSVSEDEPPTLDAIVELFVMIRGLREALRPTWRYLVTKTAIVAMTKGSSMTNYTEFELPEEFRHIFQRITDAASRASVSSDEKKASFEAIAQLEMVYKDVLFFEHEDKNDSGILLKFMAGVPTHFISMLRQQNPVALVIMAHYVILFRLLKRWWVQGVSDKSLGILEDAMPASDEMRELLVWPKLQLEHGLPAFNTKAAMEFAEL